MLTMKWGTRSAKLTTVVRMITIKCWSPCVDSPASRVVAVKYNVKAVRIEKKTKPMNGAANTNNRVKTMNEPTFLFT